MTQPSPYKGLLPYDRDDRDNFFGREHEKDILLGKILSHKLTLLYAASGVGKSSLLGAAVIPELEDLAQENLDVAYHRTWIGEPAAAIKDTVRQALRRRKKIAEADLRHLDGDSLSEFFALCGDYSSEPLILVLDQFEELFRYHAGLPHFLPCIDQLSQVMTTRQLPVTVVISMREDFLAELSVFRGKVPDLLTNYYRLQKLNLHQTKQAIVQPVRREVFGFDYDQELLEVLIRDLAERHKEQTEAQPPGLPERAFESVEGPYLQIVCQELWNRERHNPEKIIRKQTYDDLGGANAIVKRYFDGVMGECTRAQRKLASRAFTLLVTESGTKMAYPERVLAHILKVKLETLHTVLQKLNAACILRDEQRPEGTWYELYHDVFAGIIETWNRAFLAKKRRTEKILLFGLILALLVALSLGGYLWVQDMLRFRHNMGKLQIQNPAGATLTLTRSRHYRDEKAYPAKEKIPLQRQVVYLPGPADYTLTAHREAWAIKTISYPVYIQGYEHHLAVTVTPPPSPQASMVYIPGGVFRMGDKDNTDGFGSGDELPHHDVEVDGFFMDQYEVTNAQYRAFIQAGGYTIEQYWSPEGWRFIQQGNRKQPDYLDRKGYNNPEQPVVTVTWYEAEAYCHWQNKRLPTEAEWEKAAAGPEGYTWSFGNVFDGSQTNFCDQNCDQPWKDAKVNDGYALAAPVGSYAQNGYGLYDMSGNVWEWVEDWYDRLFYAQPEAVQKNPVNRQQGEGRRVVRGGSWGNDAEDLRVAFRLGNGPDLRLLNVGFRCAVRPPR